MCNFKHCIHSETETVDAEKGFEVFLFCHLRQLPGEQCPEVCYLRNADYNISPQTIEERDIDVPF